MDWTQFGTIVTVVVGAITGIGILWRLGLKAWALLSDWFMESIRTQITDMSKNISFIVGELKTNDGSSLRDAVVRNFDAIRRQESLLNNIEKMSWNNVELQRARMDNDPQMIFMTDAGGHCTWVNRAYTRNTGMNLDELMGSGWINAIASDQRDEVKKRWYEATTANREYQFRTHYLNADSNTDFYADIHSYKMTNPDGTVTGYLGAGSVVDKSAPQEESL